MCQNEYIVNRFKKVINNLQDFVDLLEASIVKEGIQKSCEHSIIGSINDCTYCKYCGKVFCDSVKGTNDPNVS